MSDIILGKPYKILEYRHDRYSAHYNIPSDSCVIIPVKSFGDDFSCDVRWQDELGEDHLKENLFFHRENLAPIDPMMNYNLYEIWNAHYGKTRAL